MVAVIDPARRDDAAHGRPHHPVAFAQESADLRRSSLFHDRARPAARGGAVHRAWRSGSHFETIRSYDTRLHGAQPSGGAAERLMHAAMVSLADRGGAFHRLTGCTSCAVGTAT